MLGGVDSDRSVRGLGTIFLFSAFGLVSVSMVVLIGLSVIAPPMMNYMVEAYTFAEPVVLPVVEFTDDEKGALEGRVEAFTDDLGSGMVIESMELSEDELNILVANDDTASKVHLKLRGSELVAEMSISLENDLVIGLWRSSMAGRYISGVARLGLEIEGDFLAVDLVSFRVKGKPVPNWLKRVLQREIDGLNWLESDEVREVIGGLEAISIDEGQLKLHPKIIGTG